MSFRKPNELRRLVIEQVLRNIDDVEGKKRHYLDPELLPLWKFYNRAIKDTTTNKTKFNEFVTLLTTPASNIWLENRIKMPVPLNPDGSGFLTQPDLLELMIKTALGGFDPALNTQNIMTNAKRLLLGLLQCKNVKAEFTNLYVWDITFFKDTFEGGVVFTLKKYYEFGLSDMSLIITDHQSKKELGYLHFTGKPIEDRANYLMKEKILPPLEKFNADVAAATATMRGDIKRIESIIEGLFADENLDDVVVTHIQPTGTGPDELRELAKVPPNTNLFCIALAHFLLFVGLPYTIQENIAFFASFVDRGVVMQSPRQPT